MQKRPIITPSGKPKLITIRNLKAVMQQDHEERKPGNHGEVYGIASLSPSSILDKRIPTLKSTRSSCLANRVDSDQSFKERLIRHAPFFEGFDFKANAIVLAGGAAAGILMQESKNYSDYDCFLVGHCDETAMKAISAFGDHLFAWSAAQGGTSPIRVCRTKSSITFVLDAYEEHHQIQFILRHYSYGCEVIRGFDMGSCAVAWDGETVTMSAIGRFAAETHMNIVNLRVRRANFEKRLGRYFDRGYGIILPGYRWDCDLTAMPYLMVNVNKSNKCIGEIEVYEVDARNRESKTNTDLPAELNGDKGHYESMRINYTSASDINSSNAKALMRAHTGGATHIDRWLCATADFKPGLDLQSIMPELDLGKWMRTISHSLHPSRISTNLLRSLVGNKLAIEMLTMLVTGELSTNEGISQNIAAITPLCEVLYQELQKLIVPIPIIFRGVTDATALHGDSEVSEAEWYGYDHTD